MNQETPFAVQVEPVEGCSLACSFCGIQSIRDNGADAQAGVHGKNSAPYRFMDIDTALHLASEIQRLDWNPRIEFAMHGEPTMHPHLAAIISGMRAMLPKHYFMVTSNGSGIMRADKLASLFAAGLDTLALDDYKHSAFGAKVKEFLPKWCAKNEVHLFHYPDDPRGSPHTRFKGKRVTIIHDISDNTKGTHKLTNQGGNSFGEEALVQRCAKPFRELSVRWDGNVALCCDDWRGTYKIGNVLNMRLDAIWNHERFAAARRYLYQGNRAALQPCNGCNVRTYRNGLLPDKMGKSDMAVPTIHDKMVVAAATAGKVFSLKIIKE